MKRIFYAAGINRPNIVEMARGCEYWLLSFGSLPSKWPTWLDAEIKNRHTMFDPGSFSLDGPSYQKFRRIYAEHYRPNQLWLAYDEPGDGESTEWYLKDQRRRKMNVVPVWQAGMSPKILEEPYSAVGGLVPLPIETKIALLKTLLWEPDGTRRNHGKIQFARSYKRRSIQGNTRTFWR